MEQKNKKLVGIALLLILLCGGFLRFYRLGEKSLWLDEITTYEISTGGINILKSSHSGYFLLTKLATKLGTGEFVLRLPSAILGILGILAIFLLSRAAFDERTALIAALTLSIWTEHINFSQEARYYSAMFCYSTVVFYTLLLFFKYYWWCSIIILFFSYLSYLNHPTGGVLLLTTIIFFPLWFVLFSEERSNVIHNLSNDLTKLVNKIGLTPQKKSTKKPVSPPTKKKFKIISFVILTIIFVILIYLSGYKLLRRGLFELSHLGGSKTPSVEFTIDFFWQHIKSFTPPILPLQHSSILSFIIVIIGIILLAKRQLSLTIFYLLLVVTTFVAIFSVSTGQKYYPKYIFFIAPMIIVAFAGGLLGFLNLFYKFKPSKLNQPYFQNVWVILVVGLLVISNVKDLSKYYKLERTAIKQPLKEIKKQFEKQDLIAVYYQQIGPGKYYINKFGLPEKNFLPLPAESGRGCINRGCLKRAGISSRNIWFIDMWTDTVPSELRAWIQNNFSLIATYPSIYEENTVSLYKWKYPAAFIYNGNTLHYTFSPPESVTDFVKSFLSDRECDCKIKATLLNTADKETKIKINLNGNESNWHLLPAKQETLIEELFHVSASENQLKFKIDKDEVNSKDIVVIKNLSIIPQLENNWILQAEEPDRVHPTWNKKTLCEDDIYYLKLMRNSFADYLIELPREGQYKFSLRAKNDKPGPVLLEISVDDTLKGILSFEHKDNSWEIKSFPLALSAGLHRFTVSFINDFGNEGEEDANNDAIIDYIQLQRLEPGAQVNDDRLKISDAIFRISNVIPSGLFIQTGNEVSLAPEWQILGDCKAEICFEHLINKELPVLKLYVEPESRGLEVLSPPFEISEDKLFYWSVKLKTEDLLNHSANALMYYFNQQRQIIKIDWSSIEGINKTTDWIRHIYFHYPPPQAKYALIGFAIYPNSNRPSAKGGYVYIADFRQELP